MVDVFLGRRALRAGLLDPPLEVFGHAPAEEMGRGEGEATTFRILLAPWLSGEAQINPTALDGLAKAWGLDAGSTITKPEVSPPEPRNKGRASR